MKTRIAVLGSTIFLSGWVLGADAAIGATVGIGALWAYLQYSAEVRRHL